MATHCSILACRISRTEKPGRLQSMQSQNISMHASSRAFGAAVTKSGHKAAAFLQRPVLFLFFPLSVHSLLFSIGVELISETVFLLGVQEHYSVILRCLSLLSLGSCSI